MQVSNTGEERQVYRASVTGESRCSNRQCIFQRPKAAAAKLPLKRKQRRCRFCILGLRSNLNNGDKSRATKVDWKRTAMMGRA
jgi:hypothetical protein